MKKERGKKLLYLVLLRILIVPIVFGIFLFFSSQAGYFNKNIPYPKNNPSPPQDQAQNKEVTYINEKFEDIIFPENFFFGTASSDFQTTGGNGLTDWNNYIQTFNPPLVGPGIGTDFLNRYKEDFDLAGEIGIQVHRLSLEWSRIEPEEGRWDKNAIEKYKEIFGYMKTKGIEPMICLNHFALPLWVVEKGGYESKEFKSYYARYAKVVAETIGKPLKIKWWLTFNEPQVILGQSYIKGAWPPYKTIDNLQDTEGTQRLALVINNLMEAHRLSYRSIHEAMDGHVGKNKIMVGLASVPGVFYPNDAESPLDQLSVNMFNFIGVLMFDFTLGTSDRDFIGLNYYGRTLLKFHISLAYNVLPWLDAKRPFVVEWVSLQQNRLNHRPKEFYPKGLYDLIKKFKNLDLPIVVTENGIQDSDDKFREEFIVIHLKAIHDAMKDGANVVGYQYWTLADTWEWDGFFSQMGLIEIDRNNNLERKLRPSVLTYAEIINTKTIKKELLEKHKELMSKIETSN